MTSAHHPGTRQEPGRITALGAAVDAVILRDNKIDRADVERMQQRDINLIVCLWHWTKARCKIGIGRPWDTLELFKFGNLTQRDFASLCVFVAVDVFDGGFMDEDVHAMLIAELDHAGQLGCNLLLVL